MSARPKITKTLLCLLCHAVACKGSSSKSDADSESGAKTEWAEKAFEDGKKHAGVAKKACEEQFTSCLFKGSARENDKETSMSFEALLDATTAADFGFKEPTLWLDIWIEKHASATEASEAAKNTKEDGCIVRKPVLGKPLTVTASCSGDQARACCDELVKGRLNLMLMKLAPLY